MISAGNFEQIVVKLKLIVKTDKLLSRKKKQLNSLVCKLKMNFVSIQINGRSQRDDSRTVSKKCVTSFYFMIEAKRIFDDHLNKVGFWCTFVILALFMKEIGFC